MAILVTGGAGYIGSATVERLLEKGAEVVVLDDLYRGHRAAVPKKVPFYEGKIGDEALVQRILDQHAVDACVHFAALAYVGESVNEPARYYENNTAQGISLLKVLINCGVRRFVFSSTCATYGEPEVVPIPETCRQWPKNPYGWSKLMMERILSSYDEAYGFKFVALRYFKAAGATAERGEFHEPESHLIPNVLAAATGERKEVAVFGTDYATPDGTAIRDYVHITDLADAHIAALDHLRKGASSDFINLGTGDGYSVLEVIETTRKVTGAPIPINKQPRRPGDPAKLVADARKAKAVLAWTPTKSDLASILRTQWEWRKKFPKGYQD
jgi:UDP-glucose 4-epimerase